MLIDDALRAFRDAVCGAEPEIDLALGALEIARVEHPDLVAPRERQRLDVLARRSGAGSVGDSVKALHRLREFLFEEEGFRGPGEGPELGHLREDLELPQIHGAEYRGRLEAL